MNWDHLRVFLAVAEHGSAHAASKALGVQHSTVIRRLEQLEADLHTTLLNRLPQGYSLTERGQLILPNIEAMQSQVDAVRRKLRVGSGMSGKIMISQPEKSLLDISRVLANFAKSYPEIELNIVNTDDVLNMDQLQADIAIRLTDNPPEPMIGRKICDVNFAVYGHREYLQSLPTISIQSCSWILWTGNNNSIVPEARQPDALIELQQPDVKITMRSNRMEDTYAAISQQLGVGILSKQQGEANPDLIELPFNQFLKQLGFTQTGLWTIYHPDLRHTGLITTFEQMMKAEFS